MAKKKFDDLMQFKNLDGLLTWMKENPADTESIVKDKESTSHEENKSAAIYLTTWTSEQCKPERVRLIAQKIGYNDSPLFFAKKKKARLVSEVIIANTAIAIFAANMSVNPDRAKVIIDAFLDALKDMIFAPMEKIDPDFSQHYENRISSYFSFLQSANVPGMGDSFIKELGAMPSAEGRHFLIMEFGSSIKEVHEALKASIAHPWL